MTEIYILELILAGQSTQAELRQIQGDPTDCHLALCSAKVAAPPPRPKQLLRGLSASARWASVGVGGEGGGEGGGGVCLAHCCAAFRLARGGLASAPLVAAVWSVKFVHNQTTGCCIDGWNAGRCRENGSHDGCACTRIVVKTLISKIRTL
jgi:hypothetical protein